MNENLISELSPTKEDVQKISSKIHPTNSNFWKFLLICGLTIGSIMVIVLYENVIINNSRSVGLNNLKNNIFPEIPFAYITPSITSQNQLPSESREKCPPDFDPVPTEPVIEKIVIAIDEESAVKFPNWKNNVLYLTDYINSVLAKNTQKRYQIEKYMTYSISEYETLGSNKDFHFNNGYGGTTIFFYVRRGDGPLPDIVNDSGLVNVASYNHIDNLPYQNVWLVENHNINMLMDKILIEAGGINPNGALAGRLLHELGHTNGLAFSEWYSYNFEDKTHEPPELPPYSYYSLEPQDPMSSSNQNGGDYKFSELNAWIINHNTRHTINYVEIANFFAPKTIVKIVMPDGSLVSEATIKIYGAKKNCFYCKNNDPMPLLQTLLTNMNGEAEIENVSPNFELSETSNTPWMAKIIKAYKNEKTGSAVFTLVDSQKTCMIIGSNVHYINITIY